MPSWTVRCLHAADAAAYRALRLEALHMHPEAFSAAWDDEAARPPDWFAGRLQRTAVFGGLDANGSLLGSAGLAVPEGIKSRHKGLVWGVFVQPQARRTGLAAALLGETLRHAATVVEEVRLSVASTNDAALCLYTRAGFTPYGLEPRALKVGARYHDEVLMALGSLDRWRVAAVGAHDSAGSIAVGS